MRLFGFDSQFVHPLQIVIEHRKQCKMCERLLYLLSSNSKSLRLGEAPVSSIVLGNQYTFERYFACYTEKGQTPRFQAQEQVYARNKVNQQNYDINVISHHVGS
jgi:hypothetical protein